jgi:hypothetical protein
MWKTLGTFLCLATAAPLNSQRTVHVLVALCDNEHQGIVKVPAGIGNGQNPRTNLYWGAGYGVRTHFDRSDEWLRQPCEKPAEPHILERAVWKHRDSAVYLVADAYDGRHIREATEDLLLFASGGGTSSITADGMRIAIGGGADLVGYVGHNGLMDFALERSFNARDDRRREVVILGCISKRYFTGPLRTTGAQPLLWTTGLMAPEAYTLKAVLGGWVARESDAAIHERAAKAYDQYQKCGINGARRLFATGW